VKEKNQGEFQLIICGKGICPALSPLALKEDLSNEKTGNFCFARNRKYSLCLDTLGSLDD
jgi:hypothetical protein